MSGPIAIASLDDSRLDPYRNVRDADLRGRDGRFLVESRRVVERFFASGWGCESCLFSPEQWAALAVRPPGETPVYLLPREEISQIAGYRVHGGALAVGDRAAAGRADLDAIAARESAVVVCLERVTHVDNIGSTFRNAAAFGADAVVLDAACADPLFRKAIRVSMGRVFNVPWIVTDDLPGVLSRMRADDVTVIGAELTPDAVSIHDWPAASKAAVVLGSEGHGLSAATLAACDVVAKIPMAEDGISLNVAGAAAVFLYEAGRRR